MRRQFVNLLVDSCIGHHPVSTLHRINPWRCFYPTTQQALAAAADTAASNRATITEEARLPRAALSFYKPCPPDDIGDIHYASVRGGGSINDIIISTDQDGNTLLCDAAARAVWIMPTPHEPKSSPVSLAVGDGLYLLNKNPGPPEDHPFEALIHRPREKFCFDEDDKWYWRSLQPPPYAACDHHYGWGKVEDDEEYRRRCYERNGRSPYVIGAYTVVGGSQIWISTTEAGGTFSFDTESGVWSKAGDWALPFYGRVEYAAELGLWFGFTNEGRRFAACDLGASSPTRPPVLKKAWDELAPPLPPRWVPVLAFVLPLGSGKFCVARMFDLADEGWCREKDGNEYLAVETFAVFTGVDIERGSRGALRMVRHKSRRYSLGRRTAEFL